MINRRVRYEAEYGAQKREGHAFFPYAMFHDVVVNLLIVLIIVLMTVVWHATAGPDGWRIEPLLTTPPLF